MESEILTQMHRRIVSDFLDILILLKLRNGILSDEEIIFYIQQRFDMPAISGAIYSCLYRLEKDGLVRKAQSLKKKLYALTPKGEQKVKTLLSMRDKILGLVINLFI